MSQFLTACEHAARAGGRVLLDWFGRAQVRAKGQYDMVTEADLASEAEIRRILLGAYPDHGFLGEEGTKTGAADAEYRWIVDPLDGTTNYVHQVPHYCVSVALQRHDKLLCGAVFDPVLQECFTAQAGAGAHLNRQRISTSGSTDIGRAVVAVSFPPHVGSGSREVAEFARVIEACHAIRRTGSAALNLCYVAAGRFDAYWGGDTSAWDVAAGALMIQEAGGVITGRDGLTFDIDQPKFVAAATPLMHEQMMRLLGD